MPSTLAITAWSAISPFGMTRESFVDGVIAGRSAATDLDHARWNTPDKRACLVPDFDIRTVLGGKGTRSMTRVAALAVTAVGQLIREAGPGGAEDTALVLGTTIGSAQTNLDIARDTLTGERPFDVEPSRLPYGVMNSAAGQCAIWHGLKGPNATIAAGRPTGLAALSYARRLLLTGRVARVLCGAAEEYTSARSWIDFQGRDGDPALPGEGCAMFVLELDPVQSPVASVVAVDSRVCVDGDWRATVATCVERVSSAAPEASPVVSAVCPSGADDAGGQGEQEALTEIFGSRVARWDVAGLIGDTASASAAFQLARALSAVAAGAAPVGAAPRYAVLTSTDPNGAAGAALIRLGGMP
jgi:3-oxoacyl-[acyl-carrier-protein] synthase II